MSMLTAFREFVYYAPIIYTHTQRREHHPTGTQLKMEECRVVTACEENIALKMNAFFLSMYPLLIDDC